MRFVVDYSVYKCRKPASEEVAPEDAAAEETGSSEVVADEEVNVNVEENEE